MSVNKEQDKNIGKHTKLKSVLRLDTKVKFISVLDNYIFKIFKISAP